MSISAHFQGWWVLRWCRCGGIDEEQPTTMKNEHSPHSFSMVVGYQG